MRRETYVTRRDVVRRGAARAPTPCWVRQELQDLGDVHGRTAVCVHAWSRDARVNEMFSSPTLATNIIRSIIYIIQPQAFANDFIYTCAD